MVRALPVARVHHAQNDFLRERGEGLLLLSPMPPLWRPIPTMGRSHRNATASSSHRFMRSARRERTLGSSLVTRTNVATPTRNREEAISIPRGTQNPRLSRLHHPRLSCSLILGDGSSVVQKAMTPKYFWLVSNACTKPLRLSDYLARSTLRLPIVSTRNLWMEAATTLRPIPPTYCFGQGEIEQSWSDAMSKSCRHDRHGWANRVEIRAFPLHWPRSYYQRPWRQME